MIIFRSILITKKYQNGTPKNTAKNNRRQKEVMKFIRLFLIAILLGQILVESLLLLFDEGTNIYNQTFYASMRLLHIGVIPSFFIFLYVKDEVLKIIALTLILQSTFRFVLECFAFNEELDWLVLGITNFDYYNFTLIITSTALSFMLNGLLNSNGKLTIYILLLLQKIKYLKR